MDYRIWGQLEMTQELARRTGRPISDFMYMGHSELVRELEATD